MLDIYPPLSSVENISSSEAVDRLLSLVKATGPVLDTTFGSGTFWKDSARNVIGCDKNPNRAKDVVCDFTNLPFRTGAVPTVVYDPPFHPFVGSREEDRFSGLGHNERELKSLFQSGLREAWRVASRHLLVKCQGFIHNHTPQWMPLWAIEICGEPFEWLIVYRRQKVISGRWKTVHSLRRNHADYMLFCKHGNKR